MGKAYCYCPKCKKMLAQVLSSFECLAVWDKAEDCYVPGDECNMVHRCPDCDTLAIEKERKIHRVLKKKTGSEDVGPPHVTKKLKEIRSGAKLSSIRLRKKNAFEV